MEKSTTTFRRSMFGIIAILLLFVCGQNVHAQNVTIRVNNGSCLASVPQGTSEYDTFFKIGGFATWQHEQLAMALTASDATSLTEYGQLSNPANNIFTSGTKVQIGKGYSNYPTCYLSLTLPKGYRFTGYTIVFSKNQETKSGGNTSVTFNNDNVETRFGETNSTFDEYVSTSTVATVTTGNTSTITRTSMTDSDMDNVLYFKLDDVTGNTDYRALITLESAEFYFTAEADYTPMTVPGEVLQVSAIDIPFSTSKVDYGTIQSRTYNNTTRVSYSSANVKDLIANFTMYEAESVTAGADFDGVTGNVVEYKEGSISVEDDYYRIGAEDATNPGTDEHIYYIETPSYVLLSDNVTKNPVGYRITGAKIDYKYGPTNYYHTTTTEYNTFYISYSTGGLFGTTYYLNSSGGATTTQSDRALWFIDGDGYIRTGVNGQTYLTNHNSQSEGDGYAGTTVNKDDAIQFQIDDSGYIYYTQGNNNYWLRRTTSWGTTYFRFQNNTGNRATRTISGTTSVSVFHIDSNPATAYTLKVYDKTGTQAQTINVNSENASGSVTLEDLNNDAIKIGVIGTGLIQGTLTLQALDPYIDHMSVVCQDQVKTEIRMDQSFTASDFSVSGGEFYFYLPEDCQGHQVKITFEDLISKYADETYTGGSDSNNSRYNFVKSAHYNAFGSSNNNIYSNVNEAANASLERLKVGIVGTKAFKFNNAADLTSANGIFTEYPFSLENYAATPNEGEFDEMLFTVSEEDQNMTRYVFTTDETRYNIGTATARQHRAYAYYQMIVHVQSSTYEPQVQFVPIYKAALYDDPETGKTTGNFYGAVITAFDGNNKPGYSSTNEIFEMINRCIEEGEDDFGNTDVPASSKQLLYIDFSQLAGVYEITTDEHQSMQDYSNTNAPNCLIFIPAGQTAQNDNVAYKTETGFFRAAQNIVLTDKQPFYSPYNIQVDAAKYVKYERLLTSDRNGKVTKASVMLPFTIYVDANGQHTNLGESSPSFSLHKMQAENCLSDDGVDNPGETCVFFPAITPVGTVTEANTPYLVNVLSAPSDDGLSFIVTQSGSTIYATTGMDAEKYTFTGETASGTSSVGVEQATNYNFTSYATYSGALIPRESGTYFYFAKDNFRNSDYLSERFSTVDLYPFRAYYLVNNNNGVKGMSGMNVILEEGQGNPEATGIKTVNSGVDVAAGKGYLTITAGSDQNVNVISISGVNVHNSKINGGESQTVNVPSGIYIVNGTKVVVK